MGDEILKKLPEGWKECKLIDIIELHYGKGLIEQDRKNGNIPVYGSNGIVGYHNEYLVKGPGIIIGRKGSVGEIKYSPLDFFPIDTTYYVSPKKEIDIKYMYYFLLTLRLDEMNSHSAVPGLNRSSVHSINIAIPPLTEQRKIAEILETADKAIEKTDAIIEKYRRIKQGLMQDLLTKGIDEKGQIRSEETHKFKDSPLGRLPEEWEVAKLGNQIYLNPDRLTCSKNVLINYIDIESVVDNKIQVIKSLKIEDAPSRAQRRVKCNDIIVSTVRPNLKAFAFISPKYDNYVCSTGFAVLRAKKDTHPLFLFYLVLYDMIFLKQVLPLIVGSNYPAINCSVLLNLHIPLPPLPEQHRIASVLSQIDEVIEKEERYKEKLERIKQGLMQDLLTGEVRVNHLIKET